MPEHWAVNRTMYLHAYHSHVRVLVCPRNFPTRLLGTNLFVQSVWQHNTTAEPSSIRMNSIIHAAALPVRPTSPLFLDICSGTRTLTVRSLKISIEASQVSIAWVTSCFSQVCLYARTSNLEGSHTKRLEHGSSPVLKLGDPMQKHNTMLVGYLQVLYNRCFTGRVHF
jgi:hypothetical protein